MVRAGLGIGAAVAALLPVAVTAAGAAELPPLILRLPAERAAACLVAALLGVGACAQVVGLWRHCRVLLVAGAALVCCAALSDRDVVLAVGQVFVTAALWPCACRPPAKKAGPARGGTA
ncbi:hypothetical protein [uncultured Desulfovibrio sp.]|uniref:hypothetical protein n=1 Tax=uncultured Desulfovibrio sp. TaxID=167968 RepID=UPI002635ECB9|nr:hypothetical protein [uncultured Desulfovibrio sp.]